MVVEPEPLRTIAISWNPLPLFYGRLSANVEVLFARHSALAVSPEALVFNVDRGARTVLADGFGFASPTSASVGAEVGYHYWIRGNELRGLFLGPSLLLGATGNAQVGDPTKTQLYYGVAVDVGRQEILPGGFTVGGGLGVGLIHMAGTTAAFPRLLVQIGWSF